MSEQEILESLETILHSPDVYEGPLGKRFYMETAQGSYVFSNKSVELLLALSQKLVNQKEKSFFWTVINPLKQAEAVQLCREKHLEGRLVGTVRRDIMLHQDFVFMLFVKSGKVSEGLCIVEKSGTVSSLKNKVWRALLDILETEQATFKKPQLDRILSITRTLRSLMHEAKEYQTAKHLYEERRAIQRPVPLPRQFLPQEEPFKTNQKYETLTFGQIPICEDLLKRIEKHVFVIREHRLASSLLDGINLEINQDEAKLKDIIREFGFEPTLNETINKIDENLRKASDKFDFKTCIDLTRAFLTELCVSIALEIEKTMGIVPKLPVEEDKTMGRSMDYFRDGRVGFLSEEEKQLLASINAFMSKKGVHTLASAREYARIARNIAIEIGLFLIKRLEKYIGDKPV